MKTIGDALLGVIENAAERNKPAAEDYIDPEDGLYHCGKCGERKQVWKEYLGKKLPLPIMCKCREEEVKEQERNQKAERVLLLKRDGFDDPAMEKSRFEADDNAESRESQAARNYVAHFDEFYEKGKGLVFTGSVGTGKTFYASCIANALMETFRPVLFTSVSRYIRGMEGEYGNRNERIDYLRKFDLVVFDDLGVERSTPYMNELIYAIIDGRVRSGKPMLVTTNLPLDVLKKTDNVSLDAARIYDRILAHCIPIPFEGTNLRRKQAREEYVEFKKILGI